MVRKTTPTPTNPILTDMRVKVEERVAQLRADIEEASLLLAAYQAELKPLLAVLKAMGNDVPYVPTDQDSVPSATEKINEDDSDGGGGLAFDDEMEAEAAERQASTSSDADTASPKANGSSIPPNRWGHYKLAPRHRRFLAKFGSRKSFTRAQVRAWFNSENPTLQINSVATGINEIVRVLTEKGIIVRGSKVKGEDAWKFTP